MKLKFCQHSRMAFNHRTPISVSLAEVLWFRLFSTTCLFRIGLLLGQNARKCKSCWCSLHIQNPAHPIATGLVFSIEILKSNVLIVGIFGQKYFVRIEVPDKSVRRLYLVTMFSHFQFIFFAITTWLSFFHQGLYWQLFVKGFYRIEIKFKGL